MFVPILVRALKAFHIVDLTALGNEDIVNWLLGLLAAFGGAYWAYKRVKAGNDPTNKTTPPIETPKIVTTVVQRLTKG
jgi:hypothetical protein